MNILKYLFVIVVYVSVPGKCMFIFEILKTAKIITEGFYGFWEIMEPKIGGHDAPTFYVHKNEKLLLTKVTEMNKNVQELEIKLFNFHVETINKLSSRSEQILTQLKITPLLEDLNFIERMDRVFKHYLMTGLHHTLNSENNDGQYNLERHTLEDFAESVTSHYERSVLMRNERIHEFIVGNIRVGFNNKESVFSLIIKNSKISNEQICELSQSTNQLIFNMYVLLQMAQLKAYTMVQFSWMLLRVYNKGNFSMETNLMRQNYIEKLSQQASAVKDALSVAENEYRKCDPKTHIEGETYTEITRFLQGFIINEVDMNSDNTCRENCGYYKYSQQHTCFQNLFCAKQSPCKGNVVGCTFVDSDMWICQAPRWDKRRYDWIEYENGRTLGEKKTCSRRLVKVDSWWRWLFWHCSYCFCYCDDASDHQSNRYFNLKEVTSDINKNKVITGLRFIKSNGIVHIQIQEGKLLNHGEINQDSISWRPVDDYSITDDDIEVGRDYHMLTWEHRAIDLDDLMLPENYVLTGIKFKKLGGHLNLEIRGSEFNITSGRLINAKFKWVSNDNTDAAYHKPRTQLLMHRPGLPLDKTNNLDSKHDQYVEFAPTDVDADVAQSAIPFIDTQLVAPKPCIPLVGAGIYHRGGSKSGGFIAPKVFTYNYAEQILDSFPELNEAE